MDTYAGTIYRDLTDAEDAIALARFHEAKLIHAPADPAEVSAVADRIDAAIRSLQAGRAKLEG